MELPEKNFKKIIILKRKDKLVAYYGCPFGCISYGSSNSNWGDRNVCLVYKGQISVIFYLRWGAC